METNAKLDKWCAQQIGREHFKIDTHYSEQMEIYSAGRCGYLWEATGQTIADAEGEHV